MKHLYFLLSLLSTLPLFAQPTTFEPVIEQQLSQITITSTQQDWLLISQSFSEIATTHPEKWLAHYYTAYAYMNLASTYKDQTLPIVAKHLDMAQSAIDNAKELAPDNSEILVLQGFIFIARIWESPFLNGGLYGRKISQLFKQAIEIAPENPRAYYLKGMLTYHTPRFVGGGKEKAKPWLKKAQEIFEIFNAESTILPYWGGIDNQALLIECGGNVNDDAIRQ